MCGLPGYGPGDLIDMALDGDRVTITYDAGIDRPLRLNQDEALALIVALRMLSETPGVGHREAIERALAKIESAAGEFAEAPVAVRMAGNAERLEEFRRAVQRKQRAAHDVLHGHPGRDHRAGGRPDAGAGGGRPGLPGGVVPAGRGGADVPHRPHRRLRRARRAGRAAAAGPADRRARRRVPAHPGPAAGAAAGGPRRPAGSPSTTRARRSAGSADQWLVSLRAADLGWARRLVLGLGPHVTVVSPPELVAVVGGEARAALDAYATRVDATRPNAAAESAVH